MLLYIVSAITGIVFGIVAAQVTYDCIGLCLASRPRFAIWQCGLIGFGTAAIVLIACAVFDEEFIPVTRLWLRAARRRWLGDVRKRQQN